MDTVIVNRFEVNDRYALGHCYVKFDDHVQYVGVSIERGWMNNQRRVSCVPPGEYPLVYEWSGNFRRKLWELKQVPGREECKFHSANYWYELEGCIALGVKHKDINDDGDPDVTSSIPTMRKFHNLLKGQEQVLCVITDL